MSIIDVGSPQYKVLEALQCLCSQNANLLKLNETKLAEWEIQGPGFYTTITHIIFAYESVETNVRWMATVYLKNGITKYWRKNAPNAITDSEKRDIKCLLLSESFKETVPQIAIQIAVLIGNISRFDYPQDWNELMPRLNEVIGSAETMHQHRGLLVLQQVVKALASKRLRNDRRVFKDLSYQLYPCVFQLWNQYTQVFFQSLDENANMESSQSNLEKALLTLRILRKLTIYGITEPTQFEPCALFMNSIIPCLNKLLEYRFRLLEMQQQHSNSNAQILGQLIALIEKFILKFMKILYEYLDMHTKHFINLLQISLEFSFNYVFYTGTRLIFGANNQINFPNFAIHCINLMKHIAMKTSTEDDAPIKSDAKNEFFTVERLSYISEKIITYYFLLTPKDLEQWDEDPEQYACDECGESWKYDLRPCTESFYLTLFSQYRPDMVVDLVKLIRKAQENSLHQGSDIKDIFLKDAIYKAAGLSSFNLFDEINFDEWFSNQLLQELTLTHGSNFRIIRRRIIWLIGQWTSVKFDQSLRPKVYEVCLHLLQPNEDICVRLASCKALMSTLGDFEFDSVQFAEYVQPTFSSLFALLREAKECDTKMSVLNVMSVVVDKMGDKLSKDAESLCHYLPMLWNESQDHNMLRCAILSALLQIIVAISDIPPFLASFLYPVIALSTNKNEPSHIYFLEDALELWLVVVQNSTTLTPELLQLSTNLLPVIESSSENIRTAFSIIQAYILLDAEVYLQQHGKKIVETCMNLLSDLRSEGIVMVMRLFESILRSTGTYGVELLKPSLPDIFKKVTEDDEWQMVMSSYLSIVARILILSQITFIQVLHELNIPAPFETLVDIWVRKMPLIGQSDKRKLLSLALATLLTVNNDAIYQRFDIIIQCICETLNDIMKEDLDDESNTLVDSLILTDDTPIDDDGLFKMEHIFYSTHHYDRCRDLCMKDPVHTVVLLKYFESQVCPDYEIAWNWDINVMLVALNYVDYTQMPNCIEVRLAGTFCSAPRVPLQAMCETIASAQKVKKLGAGNEHFAILVSTIDESILRNLSEYNINLMT